MDFIDTYRDIKLSIGSICNKNISQLMKLKTISTGSGGSNNIVFIGNKQYIIKLYPIFIYNVNKIEKDHFEIKFIKQYTKEFLLTNKTPHLIGFYKKISCPNIKKILPKKLNCPLTSTDIKKFIMKKIDNKQKKWCKQCIFSDMKLSKHVDIGIIEKCDFELSNYLKTIYKKENLYDIIDRILFQICFSLSIILIDHPKFRHGDLFVRNILGFLYNNFSKNQYIEYHYKNNIYYLPANGFFVKINDFGLSSDEKKIRHIIDILRVISLI